MIETGVLFGDIHSFHDLNLVLAPFTYPPAQPKENFIDIPGGDGSLDLTEALGEVKYNDREFNFKFTVSPQDEKTFEERQTIVSNALNGKRFKITLDKDPDYYWEGRCKVKEYLCNKKLRQIVVTAKVKPYKMAQHETVYSFMACEIIDSPEAGMIVLPNKRKTVVPIITVTVTDASATPSNGSVKISLGSEFSGSEFPTYLIDGPGTYKEPGIQLKEGNNIFYLYGYDDTMVTFTYREGEL